LRGRFTCDIATLVKVQNRFQTALDDRHLPIRPCLSNKTGHLQPQNGDLADAAPPSFAFDMARAACKLGRIETVLSAQPR